MATLQEAQRARDLIASQMLDGERVVSVGVRETDDGFGVGVTCSAFVALPELPEALRDVDIDIRWSGPAELQGAARRNLWRSFRRTVAP